MKLTNNNYNHFPAHPYHLVENSIWPFVTSISLLTLTFSSVLAFHGEWGGKYLLIIGLISVVGSMTFWFFDVIREATYLGFHTHVVQKGLNLGFLLFVISEVMFFLSIFWAFFHSALSPTIELGSSWPPAGIEAINPFELPLLNTVILLSSGASVTWAHHSLIQGNRSATLIGMIITIILATIFTACQGFEYSDAPFTIADSVFGSVFYFGTGLIFFGAPIILLFKNMIITKIGKKILYKLSIERQI